MSQALDKALERLGASMRGQVLADELPPAKKKAVAASDSGSTPSANRGKQTEPDKRNGVPYQAPLGSETKWPPRVNVVNDNWPADKPRLVYLSADGFRNCD